MLSETINYIGRYHSDILITFKNCYFYFYFLNISPENFMDFESILNNYLFVFKNLVKKRKTISKIKPAKMLNVIRRPRLIFIKSTKLKILPRLS